MTIENAPDELKITTLEGVNIPLKRTRLNYEKPYTSEQIVKEVVKITLRSKKEHVLIFHYGDKKQTISVDGKIDAYILVLDTLTGLFPAFIDAYTGNWYTYNKIVFSEE